jgi:hypothetical protein
MRAVTPSFIRAKIAAFEAGEIPEREYLESIMDLCVERLVDIDKGRDDKILTAVPPSNPTLLDLEEEVIASIPLHREAALAALEETPRRVPPPIAPKVRARLDSKGDAKPLTKLNNHPKGGDCVGPSVPLRKPDLEVVATGERTSLT